MTKANAILLGCGSVAFLQIVDGFFKGPLYAFSPMAFWAFDIFKFVLAPAAVLIWLAHAFSITPVSYGLRRGNAEDWFNIIVLAIFLTLVLNLLYTIVGQIVLQITGPAPEGNLGYRSVIPKDFLRFPVLVYFGLSAGFAEEIFFRALPLLYIRERFGKRKLHWWAYVVVTSLLFAAAHWENGVHEVAATFVFGVATSLLYLKLRDLWPLVGAHALIDIWNFS
jgi:membrane protease YdiL (CAAX protease family)